MKLVLTNSAESETATIEEIDEEPSVNVIESEIKAEPGTPSKIGPDGIDHSALEGLVNMCDTRLVLASKINKVLTKAILPYLIGN